MGLDNAAHKHIFPNERAAALAHKVETLIAFVL